MRSDVAVRIDMLARQGKAEDLPPETVAKAKAIVRGELPAQDTLKEQQILAHSQAA